MYLIPVKLQTETSFQKLVQVGPKNYRPISLLPLISKVLEKVIHNQTQTFLTENNCLYCYQSSFRKFHSKDTCLAYLNDKIVRGIDEGLMTGLILIDLQKAFDTIDHEILFKKLVTHSVKFRRQFRSLKRDQDY